MLFHRWRYSRQPRICRKARNVVVFGRPETKGAQSPTLEQTGGNGLFVETPVILESDIAALVAGTPEHFGRIDFAFKNVDVALESDIAIAKQGRYL